MNLFQAFLFVAEVIELYKLLEHFYLLVKHYYIWLRFTINTTLAMKKLWPILLLIAVLLIACAKEPGVGGTATIVGKVYAYDYNAEMTNLRTEYYAPDEDVFIIFGEDSIFSDRTLTNFDGTYRFKYLRPGTYTIFAYSKNLQTKLPPLYAVKKTISISSDQDIVTVEDIEIVK